MRHQIFTGRIPVVSDTPRDGVAVHDAGTLLQPVYLLADSQLLFWSDERGHFVERIAEGLPMRAPRAAYVGASNGDNPDHYTIFLAAMEALGPSDCRLIHARPTTGDEAFLDSADVVLLAGGDVRRGWTAMEESGLAGRIVRRYLAGAALIGVSAGAVQLGAAGWDEGDDSAADPFPTFGLVPFIVSAHDEKNGWDALRRAVSTRGGGMRGIGIPAGGGLVAHPDGKLEPVRHPAYEVSAEDGRIVSNVLLPSSERL
jgi:peptidase E